MRNPAVLSLAVLGLFASVSTASPSDATRHELGSCEEWGRPDVTCHSFNWEGISCVVTGCDDGGRCQVAFGLGILRT